MAESISCTVEGQTHTSGTLGEFKTNAACYAGKSGNYYYTYFQKFTVPEFAGIPESVEFGLCFSSVYSSGHILQAAIVSSLDNSGLYINATSPVGEVEDEYQLAAGQTPSFANVTSFPKAYTFSLDGSKLLAGGTYYLILWASTVVGMTIQSTISAYGDATAVLTYEPGAVRLDTGTESVQATAYLDTGTELVRAVPYVDTGSGWVIGS